MIRVVFGIGSTLYSNWNVIREKFAPSFGIDNNPLKCGKVDAYTGLFCHTLSDLKDKDNLEVLITIGDPYASSQVESQLEIQGIRHFSLLEVADIWSNEMSLPKNLSDMRYEDRKIVLFNTAEHDNVGDHLIALSEMKLIRCHFPNDRLFEVTDNEYFWHHEKIRKMINDSDMLLISGGGFLGSLWLYNCEGNVRSIIREYPKNKILILPQTIYFDDSDRGRREYEKSREIYKNHENLKICAREQKSYRLLVQMLGSDRHIFLFPDMACFYDTKIKFPPKRRNSVFICFRSDKESILSGEDKSRISARLEEGGLTEIKGSMHSGVFASRDHAGQVDAKMKEISEADLVVTDTLHCMVFAALVGTECIAFDNLSGKVGNVYKWIENNEYVHYCNGMEEFMRTVEDICNEWRIISPQCRDREEGNTFSLPYKEKMEEKLCSLISEGLE